MSGLPCPTFQSEPLKQQPLSLPRLLSQIGLEASWEKKCWNQTEGLRDSRERRPES